MQSSLSDNHEANSEKLKHSVFTYLGLKRNVHPNRDHGAEGVAVEQERRHPHRHHGVPRPHLRQPFHPPTV